MIYRSSKASSAVDPRVGVRPSAMPTVTGNVVDRARRATSGPARRFAATGAAIVIEDGCNVQENCTIHMFPGVTVVLEAGAHIGHGAIVHGARIGRNALVGMNAVVMDNAVVGAGAIVGALTLRAGRTCRFPTAKGRRSGNPARDREGRERRDAGVEDRGHAALPGAAGAAARDRCSRCEPLRELPPDRPSSRRRYQTWHETRTDATHRPTET